MGFCALILSFALHAGFEARLEKARAIEARRADPFRRFNVLAGDGIFEASPVLRDPPDHAWALGINFRF